MLKPVALGASVLSLVAMALASGRRGRADHSAPPPPASRTIELAIRRLGGTPSTGDVVVSNGVPLAPGMLTAAQLGSVRVIVDGRETPIYVEALQGTFPDGSLRSLLVQFRSGGAARGSTVSLEIGSRRSTRDLAKIPTRWSIPPAVALPVSVNYLIGTGVVGPTLSARQNALNPVGRRYEEQFAEYSNYHWKRVGPAWADADYYDRALTHYAFWVRTGSATYWERATAIAYDYRTDYLEKNNYATSPHWSQLEGVALHYWLTGDERSRTAVIRAAQHLNDAFTAANMAKPDYSYTEGRIQARLIIASLYAWLLDDHSRPWGQLADQYAENAMSLQRPDGSYRWLICDKHECPDGNVWGTSNFMLGLQNDALIKYYRLRKADPRIVSAVGKALDYLWASEWDPRQKAFRYWNVVRHEPTPDLNMLVVAGFGWYASVTNNRRYLTRGDQIFAAAVAGAWLDGDKQYNQQYYDSFNYVAWARPDLQPASGD